jgi:hypothetical protein
MKNKENECNPQCNPLHSEVTLSKNEIIPFGKYKGQPLDILKNDEKYLLWLRSQDWFIRDYQAINTIIINNFKEPDETPEHNKLQVIFLDPNVCQNFINYIIREEHLDNPETVFHSVKFEERGIDVTIFAKAFNIRIELKPVISDDYPAVLRQVLNNGAQFIVCKKYSATGATFEQAKKIFELSGKKLLLLSEFYN